MCVWDEGVAGGSSRITGAWKRLCIRREVCLPREQTFFHPAKPGGDVTCGGGGAENKEEQEETREEEQERRENSGDCS